MSKCWTIYIKKGCPYCEKATKLLKAKNKLICSVDGVKNKKEVDRILLKSGNSNHKTWPKIFTPDGKFVGGYTQLVEFLK